MKNTILTAQDMPEIKHQEVVSSYNEWDLLEEVVVGVVEGATIPSYDLALQSTAPDNQEKFFKEFGGQKFPQHLIKAAAQELEELCQILQAEGVIVRRPEKIDHSVPYATPEWSSVGGLYQAMPRDLLLVVGNELIESPMAWRSRYFEMHSYRPLLKEYFLGGAKWTAAPKPQLSDALYHPNYIETSSGMDPQYAITEFEPTFDAADFIRCGKDIFVQQSNVTNEFGIQWLERHLGSQYKIHRLKFNDSHPMHIDGTFMPLAPGHLLVNPTRVLEIPPLFKSWNIIYSPPSTLPLTHPLYMSSSWICMNVLMIDEKRVLVEKQEKPLIALLKENGFSPIPCNFRHFYSFGGGFHCATLDVRRKGTLQRYF